ncbi:MAG: hypothetical protein AAF799_41980 [Myxococcota bacterium]
MAVAVAPACGDDSGPPIDTGSGLTFATGQGNGDTQDGAESDPPGPSSGASDPTGGESVDSSGTEGSGEACPENPCENEGTCTLVNEQPECTCTREYWGQTCEHPRFVGTIFQGNDQALAIDETGTAWTWEIDDMPSMLEPVAGLVEVVSNPEHVTANRTRMGLDNQGEVWTWSGLEITPAQQDQLPPIAAMSTSEYYALFAAQDGGLWQTHYHDGVQSMDEPADVRRVFIGTTDLALTADGTVWRRPNASLTMAMPPWEQLDFVPPDIIEVSTTMIDGPSHFLALDASGTVWAWGANEFGQLGSGSPSLDPVEDPVMVEGLSNVVDVGAGDGFSMALVDDGTVWAWGYGADGQLGDGIAEDDHSRWLPHQVLNITDAVAISTGDDRGLALLGNGSVVQWGHGQFSADFPTPSLVPLPPVAAVP